MIDLSVVVPVFEKEKTIRAELSGLSKTLAKSGINFEIIVVVDGGHDRSFERIKKAKIAGVRAFKLSRNFGKGHAVCFGMRRAHGMVVSFIDSGGEYNASLLVFFWHFLKATGADIIVGSKMHPASEVFGYPMTRRILSLGYQFLTRMLFGLWVRDSQAGIKMFRAEVVRKVVPKLLVKSYAFDIELLAVSSHFGFNKIYEAPITLDWKGGWGLSSKKIWLVIFRMLWDTMAVYYRIKRNYYKQSLFLAKAQNDKKN